MTKTNYYHCSKCGKEGTKKTVYFNDNYDVECVKGCKSSAIKEFEEKQKQQIAEKCITNRIASLYCKAKQLDACGGFDILASERVLHEISGIKSAVYFLQGEESNLYKYISNTEDMIIKRDFNFNL